MPEQSPSAMISGMQLFDLLRGFAPDVQPRDCKLHLAVSNGIDEPRELFTAGTLEAGQAIQTAQSFRREYVLTLIAMRT